MPYRVTSLSLYVTLSMQSRNRINPLFWSHPGVEAGNAFAFEECKVSQRLAHEESAYIELKIGQV